MRIRTVTNIDFGSDDNLLFLGFHGFGNDETEMIRIIEALYDGSDHEPNYMSFRGTYSRPAISRISSIPAWAMASTMPKSLTCVSGWGCEGGYECRKPCTCLQSRYMFGIAITGDAGIKCRKRALGNGQKRKW